jgi:hypothetical protein
LFHAAGIKPPNHETGEEKRGADEKSHPVYRLEAVVLGLAIMKTATDQTSNTSVNVGIIQTGICS